MDLGEARACFPGLRDKTFLDAATVSLAPRQAADAVRAFLDRAVLCPERDASTNHIAMDLLREAAVREGAILLGVGEDEVALVESTTHALNIAAQSIPFEPGDNVVVADLEFLQVAVPWVKMVEEGLIAEVRLARNLDGALPLEAFADAIDGRTRAICVSSVQWSNGYRVDLPGLAGLCRREGIFLIVDAIQQLGAVALDAGRLGADFVVAGGHKWLNAPFGCGLMAVRRETQPLLRQRSWGYLGVEAPDGGWGTYFKTPSITPLRPYPFVATAKRWELNGTANYPGAVGLGASLALVNAIGIDAVEEHVLGLAGMLRQGLEDAGVRLVSRPEPETRSSITTFDAGGADANERLLARLLDARVYVALRYTSGVGGVRVSTHYFNDADDIERLLAVVRGFAGGRQPRKSSAAGSSTTT